MPSPSASIELPSPLARGKPPGACSVRSPSSTSSDCRAAGPRFGERRRLRPMIRRAGDQTCRNGPGEGDVSICLPHRATLARASARSCSKGARARPRDRSLTMEEHRAKGARTTALRGDTGTRSDGALFCCCAREDLVRAFETSPTRREKRRQPSWTVWKVSK